MIGAAQYHGVLTADRLRGIAPGAPGLELARRIQASVTHGEADRVVGKLVDIRGAETISFVSKAGVDLAQRVFLNTEVQRALGAAIGQRLYRLQIHRAGQSLCGQGGIGGLVYGDTGQQLGRVLIELDTTVVTGTDLLATVQQGGGEVAGQAANIDRGSATGHALRRQSGQARD